MSGGELLYFAVYGGQQLGIILGVGAQTVLLCAHLASVHRRGQEMRRPGYWRAPRALVALGLFLIVLSGLGAVGIHLLAGASAVLLAPAFLAKWALVVLAIALFLIQRDWRGSVMMALAGGNWYALFLLHVLAPAVSWEYLLAAYAVWLAAFSVGWAFFVLLMRWGAPRAAAAVPTAVPAAVAPVKSLTPPPASTPVPPPAPKIIVPTPPPAPPPVVKTPPIPPLAAPKPMPAPVPAPAAAVMPKTPQSPLNLPKLPAMLEHEEPLLPKQVPGTRDAHPAPLGLPGLHVMPQKPEDIGTHERAAVVKTP